VYYCVDGVIVSQSPGAAPAGTVVSGPWATEAEALVECPLPDIEYAACYDCPPTSIPQRLYLNLSAKTGWATCLPNSIPIDYHPISETYGGYTYPGLRWRGTPASAHNVCGDSRDLYFQVFPSCGTAEFPTSRSMNLWAQMNALGISGAGYSIRNVGDPCSNFGDLAKASYEVCISNGLPHNMGTFEICDNTTGLTVGSFATILSS
jgi:hypothetical protein